MPAGMPEGMSSVLACAACWLAMRLVRSTMALVSPEASASVSLTFEADACLWPSPQGFD